MDKNTVIEVLELLNKGKINNKGIQVIQEYCLEHNKPIKETQIFIQALSQMPMLINGYLPDALDYYKNKFNIIILKDKDNNLLNIY